VKRRVSMIAALALAVLLFALPAVFPDQPYLLHILTLCAVYAIPAVGLNLMLGYTGLVSLGHMAFAGIGGYTAAVLMVDAGLSFWLALPAATIAAGIGGGLIGVLCLRLRSHYFIIVTLAFGLILFSIMNNWDSVTRGAEGFPGIPRPAPIALGGTAIEFGTLPGFYRLVMAFAVLVFAFQAMIVHSDFGRTLDAIRQDERLAAFRGVNTMLHKVAVFAIGSAIAGMGGVLKVSFLRVAAPLSFELQESINAVLIVIVGGAGFLSGPALGALLFVGLPEYLRIARQLRFVLFGIVLLLITLFAPNGLAGLFARMTRSRRADDHGVAARD
jgi:branched-chain amino acid transport system permease protein